MCRVWRKYTDCIISGLSSKRIGRKMNKYNAVFFAVSYIMITIGVEIGM